MKKWVGYTLLFAMIMAMGMLAGYASVKWGGMLMGTSPSASAEPVQPIGKIETEIEDDLHTTAPPAPTPEVEKVFTDGYLVRTEDGDVCVFRTTTQGEQVFMQKLNITLSALRSEDQEKFREGFTVKNKAELAQLLEDFSS